MQHSGNLHDSMRLGLFAGDCGTLAPNHELVFHAHEISFVCDNLEASLGDNTGFDLDLFQSCKQLLEHYAADIREYRAEDGVHARAAMLEALYYSKGELTIHQRLGMLLDEPWSSRPALALFVFLTVCVLVSCISVVVATLPAYNPLVRPEMAGLWNTIDWTTTIVFTIETAVRLYVTVHDPTLPVTKSQRALRFLRNPYNVVDIVALIPTYMQQAVSASSRIVTGQLPTIRLLRIFRFLRRYKPVQMLLKGLLASVFALLAPATCYVMFLIFLSSVAYFAESGRYNSELHKFLVPDTSCESSPGYFVPPYVRMPYLYNSSTNEMLANVTIPPLAIVNFTCPNLATKFLTIFQASWFGVAIFSTNGFGDFIPQTIFGKLLSVVMLATGLMIAAMPLAVVDASYVTVLQQEREKEECLKETTAMRNAETSTMALLSSLERGEDHRTPGEALLLTFWSLSGLKVLDMARPLPQHLLLLDLLLEAAVKQLVNAAFEHRQLRPPFAVGPSSQVAVWVATTTTNTAWEACAAPRAAHEPLAAAVREHQVLTCPYTTVLGSELAGFEHPGGEGLRSGGPATASAASGGNIFSPQLLRQMEQFRVQVAQAASRGTSAAFALAIGESRLPPLRLLLATEHAQVVVLRSWGVNRLLLQAMPSSVVQVYRRQMLLPGGVLLLDVLKATGSYTLAHRNVAYTFSPSQQPQLGDQLLLQMREKVETAICRRTPSADVAGGGGRDTNAAVATNNSAATPAASPAEDVDPQPPSDTTRFQLLHKAQTAAEDVEDDPMDYAEAAEVVATEPGYILLLDGDVVQFGGQAVGDHRQLVSKFLLAFEEAVPAEGHAVAEGALVDLAVQVTDAIFYMVRL